MAILDCSMILDHPTASYFIFLAAHDRDGGSLFSAPVTGGAWLIADRNGRCLNAGSNNEPIEGYHQSALLPMAHKAVLLAPQNSDVHIVSNNGNFNTVMNYGLNTRRARNYRRSNKKPYASADSWRDYDIFLERRNINVTAAIPMSDLSIRILHRTAECASLIARYIGKPFSEWGAD